mgnify:CR=1 FL=1
MGHWKLWHTVQGFFISQSYTLGMYMRGCVCVCVCVVSVYLYYNHNPNCNCNYNPHNPYIYHIYILLYTIYLTPISPHVALFMAFSYVIHTSSMYTSFGFASTDTTTTNTTNTMPIFIGLVLFTQTLWAPIDKILTFLVNCNSRINEFAADEFSMKLGYGNELCSGLIKISVGKGVICVYVTVCI